jgi:murein DD-endopeptidase MepM/ murein hydrolase activator NlpD
VKLRLAFGFWLLAWCAVGVLWWSDGAVRAQDTPPTNTPRPTLNNSAALTAVPIVTTPQGTAVPPTAIPIYTATPARLPRPAVTNSISAAGVTLETYQNVIAQGQVGLVRVFGQGITGAQALWLDQTITFFPASDGYYALLSVGMEQNARGYDLVVYPLRDGAPILLPAPTANATTVATTAASTQLALGLPIEVSTGAFIRQEVTVPDDRAYLIDPDVERNEFARLDAVLRAEGGSPLWSNQPFVPPINSALTSPFGAFRVFNQTINTRHTGWDLRAPVGQPLMASADGVVAFTGALDIRGDYVLIDHGHGVFSGYAHLSQVHVTRGQTVVQGEVIGVSGDTGRSSGPHVHWEIAVHNNWVDSVQFATLWLPER